MTVYIAHSTGFDFRSELYRPLQEHSLVERYGLVFPHTSSDRPFSSRELFKSGCGLVLAEVSFPSTGMGIELGWADALRIPIVCLSKKGARVTQALRAVTETFLEYGDAEELVRVVEGVLRERVGS